MLEVNDKVPLSWLISITVISCFISYSIGKMNAEAVKKSLSNNQSGNEKLNENDKDTDDINQILDSYTQKDGPFKMVLVVNMALQMGKGKIGAQCGHAAVGAYSQAQLYAPKTLNLWGKTGCAKIALKGDDDNILFDIEKKAIALGLVTCIIQDAGRTQIPAGSTTVLAIGPAPAKLFDGLTGHLKLL